MKNAISYYYNLIFDDIHQNKDMYYFDKDNIRYVLLLYDGDVQLLNDIYKLHLNLLNAGIYVHQIILNKDNNIVTIINGSPYILLKVIYYEGYVTYDMILSFSNIFINQNLSVDLYNSYMIHNHNKKTDISFLERDNWSNLWENKNDYLEYQISQMGQKHKILRDSFSYYIGLGETSIQLINSNVIDGVRKVVAHRRIKSKNTIFDFYNPLNLIVDNRTRDMAEYLKNSFFQGNDINEELDYFLDYGRLSQAEHLLFFARMLYPTYYFDLFEDIIEGFRSSDDIKKVTKLSSDYEKILKKLYFYYKRILNLAPIEWLER